MTQNFNLGLLGQHINVTSTSVTLISNTNFSANIALANNVTLLANGSVGTAGQTLTSNGTGLYWSTGPNGYTGSAGSSGGTGFTGSTGAQGNIGYTGSTGSQGNIGYTGSAGFDGSTGFTGSKGDQGTQGFTGSAGEFVGGYVGSVSTTSVSTSSVTSNTGVIDLLTSQNVTVVQGISVGNNTVNTSITASQIFSGNAVANAKITSSSVSVTNSSSNSTITSQIVFVGNNVANAQFNLVGGSTNIAVSKYAISANGSVTIQTAQPHNYTSEKNIRLSLSGMSRTFLNQDVIIVSTWPTVNTFVYNTSAVSISDLKIISVQRNDGLSTYYTKGNHGLLTNDKINVTGIASTLDSGAFNASGVFINSVPTSTSFTLYNALKATRTYSVNTTNTLLIPAIGTNTAGNITAKLILTTTHNFKIGEYVTISGVTGTYSDFTLCGVKTSLNGTYKISAVTSNTITFILFTKIKYQPGILAAINNVSISGSPTASVNSDIANTSIATLAYPSIPVIPTTDTASGNVTLYNPVYISVSDTTSTTKVTPTTIFVGDYAGNNVLIDVTGVKVTKKGSTLESYVDGDGIRVVSVLTEGGTIDPDSAIFFANTSTIAIGNSIISTTITSSNILSSSITAGDVSTESVTIDSSGISLINNSDTQQNTVITSTSAVFGGSLYINDTLVANVISANGSVGTDGQVLTSNGTVSYWATPSGGGGGNGYTGSIGEIGYTGSTGAIGYTGSTGAIGYTGSTASIPLFYAYRSIIM